MFGKIFRHRDLAALAIWPNQDSMQSSQSPPFDPDHYVFILNTLFIAKVGIQEKNSYIDEEYRKNGGKMVTIFEYTNFRDYLKAFLEDAKKRNPAFSHRFLAQKLGLSTPNLILLIIQGKRNLTPTVRFNLSKVLKHTRKEARFFEHMVSFAQAKTHDERTMHYTSMLDLKRTITPATLEMQKYEYYSTWFNPILRELVVAPDFDGDFKTLARSVSPPITQEQARRSVELLLELGLIKKNGNRFEQTDPIVSTGPVAESIAVANFHRRMALLAAESFDRHTRQERTITSCTIALSEEQFQILKQEIADLRKRALELAVASNGVTRVYQMNMQLFPVSKSIKKAGLA